MGKDEGWRVIYKEHFARKEQHNWGSPEYAAEGGRQGSALWPLWPTGGTTGGLSAVSWWADSVLNC